ncbi:MAG: hypothetical protein JNK82_26445 [Myxococcaceae bacterium]|nr:hypothetical protein [Myxococcaceae bacterium]
MTFTLLALALAQAPEVFVDRGETYVRMGSAQGLQKGTTLEILSAQDNKGVGTGVVMEVWEGLARVSLDTAASSFKGARLAKTRTSPSVSGSPSLPPNVAPPPPAPGGGGGAPPTLAVNPPSPQLAQQRALHARVQISGGLVDARRFIVYNLDNFDWHNCKIRLPDGRGYDKMEELKANSDEGIMMFRFEPGMALRDASGLVTIYCSEGAGRFAPQF